MRPKHRDHDEVHLRTVLLEIMIPRFLKTQISCGKALGYYACETALQDYKHTLLEGMHVVAILCFAVFALMVWYCG